PAARHRRAGGDRALRGGRRAERLRVVRARAGRAGARRRGEGRLMAHAVVVVGAGAAGMGAALALQERGLAPLLIEADDRAGGKLGTESRRGFLLERAALGLLDRTGELAELCGKLGLAPSPASPAASLRFLERGGRVHAL